MALKDKRSEILAYIKSYNPYLEYNACMLDIYEGNLKKYVQDLLKKTLSENYYNQIKDRVLPINILRRYVEKISGVYNNNPIRKTNEIHAALMKFYEYEMDMNVSMNTSDEYTQLFKAYALEPYLENCNGEVYPRLRVIPYDRFLVYSDDLINPLKPTVFIKIMGKTEIRTKRGIEQRTFYFVYTDQEFDAFDSNGDSLDHYLVDNNGVNPYGVIPFYYGFRSKTKLIPTQDTDIKSMTEMIPVMLTDMGGAIMFQCFSVIYGIDIKAENLKLSPNAFWDLKSDPTSGKTPQVGTVTPQADVDKVINFIMTNLAFWLETKGIKAGSIGDVTSSNAASGISKLIDEADTTAIKKKNISSFKADEKSFWQLIKTMNNYWVSTGLLPNTGLFSSDFDMSIEFDDPRPLVDRKTEVETVDLEVTAGYLDRRSALKRLYPDLSEEQIEERLELLMKEQEIHINDQGNGNDAKNDAGNVSNQNGDNSGREAQV